MKFCKYCGKPLKEGQQVCLNCGSLIRDNIEGSKSENPKSKVLAGLLGIFMGTLGIHNFYLGYNGKAIAQLLITVLSFGMLSFISYIWGVIEGIMILTGNISEDANGNPLTN